MRDILLLYVKEPIIILCNKKYVYIQYMKHIDFHKCEEEEKP